MLYLNDSQADVRLTVDGTPYYESWATYAGGDVTAADSKTRPGAMGHEVSVGGVPTRGDITITIQWSDIVLAKYAELEAKVGRGKGKVSINWLGPDRIALPGALFARTGTLKSVSDPNYDHNGSVVGVMTVVLSCDEMPA